MRKNNLAVTQRVVPRGRVDVVNGETPVAAKAAESVVCTNLREVDDALEVAGMPRPVATLLPGERVLAVDAGRMLTVVGRAVRYNDATVATAPGDVIEATVSGRFVVVTTTGGPLTLRHVGDRYRVLDTASAIPLLRLTAGSMTSSEVEIGAITFANGYTRWQTPLDTADVAAVTAAVAEGWAAFEAMVKSRGRYCAPVLARYAVRLWDDSVLWASRPVLLGGDLLSDSRLAAATVTVENSRLSSRPFWPPKRARSPCATPPPYPVAAPL